MLFQPSDSILPFLLKRVQFPVSLSYSITINKAQGQTFEKVGIFLDKACFSHGQLYVAFSRTRCFADVKVNVLLQASNQGFHNANAKPFQASMSLSSLAASPKSQNVSNPMSSVDYQVAPSFPLVGLVNNGNTCYAYSILQVLLNVPEQWGGADISNFNSDIIDAFHLTISLMNNSDTVVHTSFFLPHLSSFMREGFNAHNQHDVPKVLQALLNELVRISSTTKN